MPDFPTEPDRPLRDWLSERTAIRRPVGWWIAWVVVAIGLNAIGVVLATREFTPPPEVPYLEFAEPEGMGSDPPATTPDSRLIALACSGDVVGPITVEFTINGVISPPSDFPSGRRPDALRVPLPSNRDQEQELEVALKSVRGAILGKQTTFRLKVPAQYSVGFNAPEYVIAVDQKFSGTEVSATGELPADPEFVVRGPNGTSTKRIKAVRSEGPGIKWRLQDPAVPEEDPGNSYTFEVFAPPGARVGKYGKQVVKFEGMSVPKVLVGFSEGDVRIPPGEKYQGAKLMVTGVLSVPPEFLVEDPSGERSERTQAEGSGNKWRIPNTALPKQEPGKNYTIHLFPPPGTQPGNIKQIVRFEASPRPTVYVKDFKAVGAGQVESTAQGVTFLATLTSEAPEPIQLKLSLSGDGKTWVKTTDQTIKDGWTIDIEAGAKSGRVTIPLRDRKEMMKEVDLVAKAEIPKVYRSPADIENDSRSVELTLRPPPSIPGAVLTIQVDGDKTLEFNSMKKQQLNVTLSLKPEQQTEFVIDLGFVGDALLGKHFRVIGTDEKGRVTIPPKKSVTLTFEPVDNPRLQPDREVTVKFLPPPGAKVENDDTIRITLTDDLKKSRNVLVLLLAPPERQPDRVLFPAGWDEHLAVWEKDPTVGREHWVRAIVVGAKIEGGKLLPSIAPMGQGKEPTIPVIPEPDGKDRRARLDELVALALQARQDLFKDLPENAKERKEIRTVVVWRSGVSPFELQDRQPPKALEAEMKEELDSLKGRFAFLWYGGSREVYRDDPVVAKVLDDILKEWPDAITKPHQAIRFVMPSDNKDLITTGLKFDFKAKEAIP